MNYGLGTIQIEAEIVEESNEKIECFRDITIEYGSLGRKQKEHLYAVFLKNDNEKIGDKLIGLGGRDTVKFDIQDLVRTAALVNAGGVILIHNHPSGHSEPTQEDIDTTERIHDALETIGVQLLDHVIITQEHDYSMRGQQDGPF